MSWIFSFLLVCYASVRLVLWTRGQWRWLSLRHTLPIPPDEIAPPEHLSAGLGLLFSRARRLRIDLTPMRRMLATVAATDPDVPLGRVRDARYRRALMESRALLRVWLRECETIDPRDLDTLTELGLSTQTIADRVAEIHDAWKAVSRARALDTFPIEDLLAVQATLDRADQDLAAIEAGLSRVGDDPYRQTRRTSLVGSSQSIAAPG